MSNEFIVRNGIVLRNGSITTGGEKSPDVVEGGLCLLTANTDGNIFSAKFQGLSHNFAGDDEIDTYLKIWKLNASNIMTMVKSYSNNKFQVPLFLQGVINDIDVKESGIVISAAKWDGSDTQTNLSDTEIIVYFTNQETHKTGITGNGTLKFFEPSAKILTGNYNHPSLIGGGLSLFQNVIGGYLLTLSSTNLTLGITDIPEKTYGMFEINHSTNGGLSIKGASKNTTPLVLNGVQEADTSNAYVAINAWWGDSEVVSDTSDILEISNSFVPKASFKGNGSLWIDTNGKIAIGVSADFAKVVAGGMYLQGSDGTTFNIGDKFKINRVFTKAVNSTIPNFKFQFSTPYTATQDFNDIIFEVIKGNVTNGTNRRNPFIFNAAKQNGSGTVIALDSDRPFMSLRNNDVSIFNINASGTVSTGGELLPDVSNGGLCLNQGAEDTNILTLKSSSVNHGLTTAETDTYARFVKHTATGGGLLLEGLSSGAVGLYLKGYVVSAPFGKGGSVITFNASKLSGGIESSLADNENIASFLNNGVVKANILGDGSIITHGGMFELNRPSNNLAPLLSGGVGLSINEPYGTANGDIIELRSYLDNSNLINHGNITNYANYSTFGAISKLYKTDVHGGIKIKSIVQNGASVKGSFILDALAGAFDATSTQSTSYAPIMLRGGFMNTTAGGGLDTVTSLFNASENLFIIQNGVNSSAVNVVLLKASGQLNLFQGTATNNVLNFRSSLVNHGINTGSPDDATDVFGSMVRASGASGGLKITGMTESSNSALLLNAYGVTGSTTVGMARLTVAKGTTRGKLAYDERVLDIFNYSNEIMFLNGNGNLSLVAGSSQLLTGNITGDSNSASLFLYPSYSDGGDTYTVERHNYIELSNPTGSATVTDAYVFRFDAAAGTHKAVDGGSTKTTPSSVQAWVKININGVEYYVPAYTSKTA